MDIKRRLEAARGLTPVEQQLAATAIALGPRVARMGIKEFAHAASASIPSVHRFCKKLGLEGFKELKIEFARSEAAPGGEAVDINFPFAQGEGAETMLDRMASVYAETVRDTRALLDAAELDAAAELLARARSIDIYTQSHNLYPAQMFCNRLLSCGFCATCPQDAERQIWTALRSDESHAALFISYSGLGASIDRIAPILSERGVPMVLVGSPGAQALNPGMQHHLNVSDRESLQDRITQFASHIAVQFALDSLFGCIFARDWDRSREALEQAIPYTALPTPAGRPPACQGLEDHERGGQHERHR